MFNNKNDGISRRNCSKEDTLDQKSIDDYKKLYKSLEREDGNEFNGEEADLVDQTESTTNCIDQTQNKFETFFYYDEGDNDQPDALMDLTSERDKGNLTTQMSKRSKEEKLNSQRSAQQKFQKQLKAKVSDECLKNQELAKNEHNHGPDDELIEVAQQNQNILSEAEFHKKDLSSRIVSNFTQKSEKNFASYKQNQKEKAVQIRKKKNQFGEISLKDLLYSKDSLNHQIDKGSNSPKHCKEALFWNLIEKKSLRPNLQQQIQQKETFEVIRSKLKSVPKENHVMSQYFEKDISQN